MRNHPMRRLLILALLFLPLPAAADINLLAGPELMTLVARGDLDAVKTAILAGENVNSSDRNGNTPLLTAVRDQNEAMVEVLLKGGAKANVEDRSGKTPLMWAAESGNTAIMERLIAARASIDRQNGSGVTALMVAARSGRLDAVRLLLEKGAKPGVTDYTGRDAIGWADESRDPAIKAALSQDAGR